MKFLPLLLVLFLSGQPLFAAQWIETRLDEMSLDLADKPSLYIKCQLRIAMDCEVLRRRFFDQYKGLDRVDSENALIQVLLTDESSPQGTVVHSLWSSKKELSMVSFPLPDLLLPPQYDSAQIQAAMITLLTQGTLAHIRVKSGTGLEQALNANLSNPGQTTPQDPNSPFFVDISLSGYASKSGIGAKNADGTNAFATSNATGLGSVTLNYSTKRVRVFSNVYGSYSKTTQPGVNETLSAENFSRGAVVVGVYSIDQKSRWNVAIIHYVGADPGSNLKRTSEISPGLEYTLVPFRIDQPYEFRVRGYYSHNTDRLVLANDRGNTKETYASLAAELYLYWLLLKDKASITTSLGGSKNISHDGYYKFNSSLSFNYQITSNIRFTASGSYGYLKKSIRFPGTPDYSNPLQTRYLSGFAGGNFSTSIGVAFTLGKGGTIYSRDRRFQ